MMLVPDSTAAFTDQSASTNTVMKILLMEVKEGLCCLNGSGHDHGVPPTIELRYFIPHIVEDTDTPKRRIEI